MASQAYYDWKAAGEPYSRARPTLEFLQVMRGHGYTVYDYPDLSHLTAATPEDHTPFSAAGWPIASKRWVGHADDVMPPAITSSLPTLPDVARQIIEDKDAKVHGTEFIKYMNWTDETGRCRHESWAHADGSRTTTDSTDKGHIHISGRSDMDTSDVVSASGWDPVARLLAAKEEEPMIGVMYIIKAGAPGADGAIWYYDGEGRRHVPTFAVRDELIAAGSSVITVSSAAVLDLVAPLPYVAPPPTLTDAQVDQIADLVAEQIAALPPVPLGDADKPTIRAAVAEALHSVTAV